MNALPRLLITLGDVSGIGPEIVARAWPQLPGLCQPIVVGDSGWLSRGVALVGGKAAVVPITRPAEALPTLERIPCLVATKQNLTGVRSGQIAAAAGRA